MKRVVAFDLETHLIHPGKCAPALTCLTYQTADMGLDREIEGDPAIVADLEQIYALVRGWLLDPDVVLVGHNIVFDLAVLCEEFPDLIPLVFAAYEADRITDTMLRGKLIDIADGCYRGCMGEDGKWIKLGYTLLELAKRYAGIPIKKEGFRLFYGPFRGVPLERWVEKAQELQERGRAYLQWDPGLGKPGEGQGSKDEELAALEACLGDSKKFRGPEGLQGMIAADPHEVVTYPLDDASSTMAVFLAQQEHFDKLDDQFRQARSAWWKQLTSAWGLRTSAASVATLQLETERLCQKIEADLVAAGLVRKDGSRDTAKAKQRMLDVCGWAWDEGLGEFVPQREGEDLLPLRLTPAGEPSLDSDACKATEDPLLEAYAELTSLKAVLNKDVPALAKGTVLPVHTHFDLAETGRTTSSSPNVMNWRRLPGIRECFVPRKGFVFAQADYSGLELATLAQACIDLLGKSTLARALNEGLDAHTALACSILGDIPYAEGELLRKAKAPHFDNARQTAKVANFGFPGGLGAAKLVLFARKTYGVELGKTDEEATARAKDLKNQWLEKWPEMRDYFAYVTNLPSEQDAYGRTVFTLRQLRSKRIRSGCSYTAACNSFFQGLGADATAAAGWLIARACYVDRKSPLFGSRIVNYVHDEFIVEAPEWGAAEAAEELSRLMVLGASEWIPDIKIAAEPCLMTVWSKDAKTLRDTTGRLVAWSPEPMKKAA